MRSKLVAVLVGLAVAASFGQTASAVPGDHGNAMNKRAITFHGTVLDADGDDDPLTAGPFVVTVAKANGNARRVGVTGDVSVAVTESTKYYGAAASGSDIADGDRVKVETRSDGVGGYVAKKVKEARAGA